MLGGGASFDGDAGGCERGCLLRGGGWRQALDHFRQVVFGIEAVGAAVGQQGVDVGEAAGVA